MNLLNAEYERIIELQALALACAEKQLETLQGAHKALRESHDEAQRELRDLRRKVTSLSREVTP